MRAVVIREIGNREAVGIEELPEPVPGPGEVRVDVRACGVNYTDYLSLEGRYQNNPQPPFTPGKDAAGVVSAVGEGVTRHRVGDRVIAHVVWGGLAEQTLCPEALCFPLPDDIGFEQAAGLGLPHLTAWFALAVRGGLRERETVLVNGASGGVGQAALGVAKALGAGRVLGGISNPAKADAVRSAGADAIVDLGGEGLRDRLREQVRAETEGRGADLVLDLVGGAVFEASLRALATYGRIVVTGFASGQIPSVRTNYLLLRNLAVVGMTLHTFMEERSPELGRAQARIFELLRERRLDPHITGIYPLEAFMEPISRIERREVVGKSVVVMGNGG